MESPDFILMHSGRVIYRVSSDDNGRWTRNLNIDYLSMEDEDDAEWLPEAGGIVYSDHMGVFFQTFYKNPTASWRYVLGFEQGMMREDDLKIYRKIQWNYSGYEAFTPWVEKMKPEDRLILHHTPLICPGIEGLEWHYTATDTWIGRLPRENTDSSE